MDIIKSFEIFKKVADLQSFTMAADELNLPKSVVSAQISKLEEHLGVRLFFRTTRKVSLSPNGQDFYERAQNILADCDEAFNYFKPDNEKISGRLRVDMALGMASKLIIPKLSEFMNNYPNINLEISSTDRNVNIIEEGFDCVLRVGYSDAPFLGCRIIGKKPIINLVSNQYIEKYGQVNNLDDLQNHYLIDYDTQFGVPNAIFEYAVNGQVKHINMRSKIRVNNSIAYRLACIAGFGIIQCPIAGVRDDIAQGNLKRILVGYEPLPLNIYLITPQKRNIPKKTKVFIDWVESLMPEYCAE